MSPVAATMTEANRKHCACTPEAHALHDKDVGITRIAIQLPVATVVQPAAVSQFPQLPTWRQIQTSPRCLA